MMLNDISDDFINENMNSLHKLEFNKINKIDKKVNKTELVLVTLLDYICQNHNDNKILFEILCNYFSKMGVISSKFSTEPSDTSMLRSAYKIQLKNLINQILTNNNNVLTYDQKLIMNP